MGVGKKKKILVIDDFPENAYTLKEILEEENFSVTTALDGASGIKKAITEKPDLIICDIMMPDINGFEVLERLRKNPKTLIIPFVFLSAKSELKDIRAGMQLGADDYITKPIDRNEILKTINLRFSKKEVQEKKLKELRQSISYALPHELRTPLVSVLGFSQIIKNDIETLSKMEITDMAEIIYNSAHRLNSLIQKILLFIKIELITGDTAQFEEFTSGSVTHGKKLITEIAESVADGYNRKDDLILEIDNGKINISEQNLRIIIDELVDNAFKFSRKKNEVRVTGLSSDNAYTIYIINHGYGMTEEQVASVGAYFQANRLLYEQPGVGLGLAISKRIVELHGGEFLIESIPNKKTMISLIIPNNQV